MKGLAASAPTVEELRTAAIHEAAHVVIALALGFEVPYVTIAPREGAVGHARIRALGSDALAVDLNRITVALAGNAAAARWAPATPEARGLTPLRVQEAIDASPARLDLVAFGGYALPDSDADSAEALALGIAVGDSTEGEQLLRWIRQRVRRLLDDPMLRARVERLADALLEHETLDAVEIEQVLA